MSKRDTLLEMVRSIREGIKTSPGLSHAPFSDEGWAIIEEALSPEERDNILEQAARACEKRAERRFEENGTREWDTGATYYGGSAAEEYEARDEEDADCAAAVRALKASSSPQRTTCHCPDPDDCLYGGPACPEGERRKQAKK